jgi:hypothetical protein
LSQLIGFKLNSCRAPLLQCACHFFDQSRNPPIINNLRLSLLKAPRMNRFTCGTIPSRFWDEDSTPQNRG